MRFCDLQRRSHQAATFKHFSCSPKSCAQTQDRLPRILTHPSNLKVDGCSERWRLWKGADNDTVDALAKLGGIVEAYAAEERIILTVRIYADDFMYHDHFNWERRLDQLLLKRQEVYRLDW